MKPSSQENQKQKQIQKQYNAYVRYSGLGIQMAVIIVAGTFGGFRSDKYLGWKIPVFTIVLSLLSVCVAIWLVVKDLLKK